MYDVYYKVTLGVYKHTKSTLMLLMIGLKTVLEFGKEGGNVCNVLGH